MKKFALILLFISGCSTAGPEVKQHCEYELVTDPSGSAKWRVVCHPMDAEDEEDCSCWEELNSDPIGDKIEASIKAPKRPTFKGGKNESKR